MVGTGKTQACQACYGSFVAAQACNTVLPAAQDADDVEAVVSLGVRPPHREVGHAPGPQAGDLAQVPEAEGAQTGHALDRPECGDGRVGLALSELDAGFLRTVPRGVQRVDLCVRAQVGALQCNLPSTCFFNCAARCGVRA